MNLVHADVLKTTMRMWRGKAGVCFVVYFVLMPTCGLFLFFSGANNGRSLFCYLASFLTKIFKLVNSFRYGIKMASVKVRAKNRDEAWRKTARARKNMTIVSARWVKSAKPAKGKKLYTFVVRKKKRPGRPRTVSK
jgi:hypothetical protein